MKINIGVSFSGKRMKICGDTTSNTISVSGSRSVFASKGILVTISDYGSDSFKFAKDKPITLMNGGNLLYLLEKHGYKRQRRYEVYYY
jgi:restriction system protein